MHFNLLTYVISSPRDKWIQFKNYNQRLFNLKICTKNAPKPKLWDLKIWRIELTPAPQEPTQCENHYRRFS
jgi:hypothetical protein